MGEFQITFSPHSVRDLEEIVRYIGRDNPEAAERIGGQLMQRAKGLSHQGTARMGSTVKNRPNYRRLVEGNYLIFYRLFPEQDTVRILRIRHAARSQKGLRLKV